MRVPTLRGTVGAPESTPEVTPEDSEEEDFDTRVRSMAGEELLEMQIGIVQRTRASSERAYLQLGQMPDGVLRERKCLRARWLSAPKLARGWFSLAGLILGVLLDDKNVAQAPALHHGALAQKQVEQPASRRRNWPLQAQVRASSVASASLLNVLAVLAAFVFKSISIQDL
eukprot:Skav210159  [mRNA]  locus=scaffold1811:70576:89397:+ [translate_table: standard]